MGKKKATGMSKRLGFTDRATIAENKDILRYNERLEREAKGLPPESDRGPRRAPSADKAPKRDRPAREPRPPRPPALDDEQRAILQAALDAAVGETGLGEAGQAVITRLAEHDSFDKASAAGWEHAAGGHAAERTPAEWDLLRQVWLSVRLALLEAYATFKPELEPTLSRERKQVARLARTAGPQRKRRKRVPTATDETKQSGKPNERKPKSGLPSPADVARRLARGGTAVVVPDGPSEEVPAEVVAEPDVASEIVAELEATDIENIETELAPPGATEQEAAQRELRDEHPTDGAATDVPVGKDQLTLEM